MSRATQVQEKIAELDQLEKDLIAVLTTKPGTRDRSLLTLYFYFLLFIISDCITEFGIRTYGVCAYAAVPEWFSRIGHLFQAGR